MKADEQMDRLEAMVQALLTHTHATDGSVMVSIGSVEDVLFDARRQRCVDKKAIEDAGRKPA